MESPGIQRSGATLSAKAPVIVALDFETANQAADSACQLAVVRIQDWRIVSEASWLIQPPTSEFMFSYIHGIEWGHVANEPRFGELWPVIRPHFEGVDLLAAHNAPFDRGVLNATCATYGLTPPPYKYLDTVHIARKVFSIFPTKLNNVAEKLNIPLQHHEALSDARACAQILIQAQAAGWAP